MRGGAAVLALALAPALVWAHGDEPDSVFNPLQFDWRLYLSPNAATPTPPADGALALPAVDPTSGGDALAFHYVSPVKHQLAGGLDVTLKLRAEKPVLTQNADGDSFEIAASVEGQPIPDAARKVTLTRPALAPGDEETMRVVLQTGGFLFEKGANVTLSVKPLMPLLAPDALFVDVGEEGSTMTLELMRVPTVYDLELQVVNLTQFDARSESFKPSDPNAVTLIALVRHDAIEFSSYRETQGRAVFLVLKGDETPDVAEPAHAHAVREDRIAAAHEIRVGGLAVRVVPNVGVVVPIGSNAPTIPVSCLRNCPASFVATISAASATTTPTGPTVFEDPRGALVPPPPATAGVPTSKDKTEERALPASAVVLLVAGVTLAALAMRRR